MTEEKNCPYTKVVNYINEVLRPPREEFGGLPVCPFAGPELDANKLMIGVLDPEKTSLVQLLSDFEESEYESALFAQVLGTPLTSRETKKYQRFINDVIKSMGMTNLKAICFNPNDKLTEVDGFNARREAPCFLINVADKKALSKAHRSILNTNYFDKLSDEYLKFLKVNKKEIKNT